MWIKPYINNKEESSKKEDNIPKPYIPLDMSGALSDKFSYIETNLSFGKPLSHTYSYLNNKKEEKKKKSNELDNIKNMRDSDPYIGKSIRRI